MTLRSRLPLSLALAACLVASACGDDTDSTESSDDTVVATDVSASTQAPEAAAYPVTIEHALGTAELASAPVRVVALSEADEDAALALGVEPIAVVETLGGDEALTWSAAARQGEAPTVLTIGDVGINVEQVAALEPDVILAGFSYFIDDQYEQLSEIAPTTAYEGTGAAQDEWQTTMRQVGKVLGKSAEADALVADVDAQLAATSTEFPELDGTSFAITSVWSAAEFGVLRSPDDSGVKLLNQLGMTLSDEIATLGGEGMAVTISQERMDVIDADVLLAMYGDESVEAEFQAAPLFQALDVAQRGAAVTLSLEEFWGLRHPTALSLPWVLDNVIPRVAGAAATATP